MPDWTTTEAATVVPSRQDLQEQLRAEQESNLILEESLADLELALEDRGWARLSSDIASEFSAEGRRRIAELCRMFVVANPLMKRAVQLRIGYIWGQGVEIRGRAGESDDDTQDVDAVVQRFLTVNEGSLTGGQACEENERALASDGNVYMALFTSPLTGSVKTRTTPVDEIKDIITNPDDRDEPWYYIREYTEQVLERGYQAGSTRVRRQSVKTVHPALGYKPGARLTTINGAKVRWDAPILHVAVNRLDGWKYGVPDAYASVAWARMYKEFLVDWAGLTKSLSKLAWKATGDNKSRAQRAASGFAAAALPTATGEAGQAAVLGPGNSLEAIPKSGAMIDANSGKPLAGMVAAGMGVPITMLLTDPGITGARATAETLDLPLVLEMTMRRMLWQSVLDRVLTHVIEAAVIAPRGMLTGTVTVDDWGQREVVLTGEADTTVEFDWPPLIDIDPVELVKALVQADGTGKMPPVTTVRLLLTAFGVKDIDELIDEVTDDDGRWVDQEMTAGQAATDRFRRGEDPAQDMG